MPATVLSLRTVKASLAVNFPDVAFRFDVAGRGHYRGPAVIWTGGPAREVVQDATRTPWRKSYHFMRQDTPDEAAARQVRADAEHAEWVAGEPARKAARAAAGKAKAAATRATSRDRLAAVSAAFPGVAFSVSQGAICWEDGPLQADVRAVAGVAAWQCRRELSRAGREAQEAARIAQEADKARQVREARTARRLARSLARARLVARCRARIAARGVQLAFAFS